MGATWHGYVEREVNNESPTAASEFPTAVKVIKLHIQARREHAVLFLQPLGDFCAFVYFRLRCDCSFCPSGGRVRDFKCVFSHMADTSSVI